ncbi:hypothetical protein D3C80_2042670 [compost metagenome]
MLAPPAIVIVVRLVPTLRTRSPPVATVGATKPVGATPTTDATVLPAAFVPNLPSAPVTLACRVAKPPSTLASL